MMRTIAVAVAGALFVLALFADGAAAQVDKKAQKNNQMVKGTIKKVDVDGSVLIVNQKLKGETVERQLDITGKTEFVIMIGKEKKEAFGKDGLILLEGKEGSSVNVKCDKDVNVLKVTVRLKK